MKKGITLQFIPHYEVSNLESNDKIKKILKVVKDNKIVLLEGKLKIEGRKVVKK